MSQWKRGAKFDDNQNCNKNKNTGNKNNNFARTKSFEQYNKNKKFLRSSIYLIFDYY